MSERSPVPEALVLCPLCSQGIGPSDYERHLQRQHGLFTYRGVRRTWTDTLEAIRADLFAESPSELAWQTLSQRMREQVLPAEAETHLAEILAAGLAAVPETRRELIVAALAVLLRAEPWRLWQELARRPEQVARQLCLLAVLESHAPQAAPVALLRRLLKDRTLPDAVQLRVMVRLLTPDESPPENAPTNASVTALAARALRWFLAQRDTRQALKLLRQLLRRVGNHPLVLAALQQRQPRAKLSCPRCNWQGERPEMEVHLWREHGLLLDGVQVREPWEIVEQWASRAKDQPIWRDRCRQAALRLDPLAGAQRAERLLLLHQTAEPERRTAYLQRAAQENATVCPWCYALVSLPYHLEPFAVQVQGYSLWAHHYEVRLSERSLQAWLRLTHPGETPRWEALPEWTPTGAIFVSSGPFVLLALVVALLWPWGPLGLVLGLLGVAGVAGLFAWLLVTPARPLSARLLDYAWGKLVPRLFAQGYEAQDARFVAGLAQLSRDQQRDDLPETPLAQVLGLFLQALEERKAAPEHVAVVARLFVEIAARNGNDPVSLVEKWASLAFEGRIALSFVQALLVDWQADFWSQGQLARLRLRLVDRAFEAGFEVEELLKAAQSAAALGVVIGSEAPRRLAALRLLWSMRASRPWDRLGPVRTAFELAAVPSRIAIFERHADVLLWCEDATPLSSAEEMQRPAVIQFTLAGVWINEELIATPPREIELRQVGMMYEMNVNRLRFRSPVDLEPLVRRLERWFRFVFQEFLPRVDETRHWKSPGQEKRWRAWGAIPCSECRRSLLPRVGEVGVGVEEAAAAEN
jgi:hypothetical protein